MPNRTRREQRGADRAVVFALERSDGASIEVMRTWYRTQSFPRHTHEYFTIGVMLSGVGSLWSRAGMQTLRRGDVIVIPPGEVHTGGLGGGDEVLSYLALHVPPEIVALCAATRGLPHSANAGIAGCTIVRDAEIAGQLRRLDAAVASGTYSAVASGVDGATASDVGGAIASGLGADDDDAATIAIDRLVAHLARRPVDPHPTADRQPPAFVGTALQIIEDCYADNTRTSLDALAAAAGVTPFHLVREFTRSVGLSPHRYVTQTRIRRARALLAGGMSPSFVAATTGFVDQSHLTTQFKRYVGTTPASYQRARA